MRMVRGRSALAELVATLGRPLRNVAVTIGNFDGVHRGHQALVATARRLAGPEGDVIVFTFDPHPARLFAPKLTPPLISSLGRRAELLGEAGADIVVVEPFTAEFAAIEAETFVSEVLKRDLAAAHIVVGYDFSFGRGRRGNTEMMQALGAELGLTVSIVRRISVHGITCSSTKIREFVLEGQVEGAQVLLGRPFEVSGQVIRGAARGRTIGYPTANLQVDADLLPKPGIYAARATVLPEAAQPAGAATTSYRCALSVGTNPTFTSDNQITVEAHLLDFAGDLYDRRLRVELVQRLRDERRFDSVEALVTQIAADVERTRELVS
jgi:riboflavin kinase / FMN adenylyltransferase